MKPLTVLLPILALCLTAGCGVFAGTAASVAVSKYQCENGGGYWDEVKGCQPQETTPTAEPSSEPTPTPTPAP